MAGDSLTQRIEAVEHRLQSLREHAQATPEQQPLLDAAAEDLALALGGLRAARDELEQEHQERMHTEQSLRLEQARLDALLHLSQISDASLQEIASFTLEQGIALTNSRIGFVGFLNEDESVYTLHAVSKDVVKECNVTGDPIQWHVVDAGIWADAIRERRTLFINDYSQSHPGKKGLPAGHPYVERFMIVPILEGERIVSIAGVGNKASDYDDSDERQIILLLSGMWEYVQRNRSREELEQAYNELEERVQQRTAELSVTNAALKEEIAERKRAEEALQEERDRLAALINSIRDEIWFADAAGRFTLVNPSGSSEFNLKVDGTTDVRQLAASLQVLRPDGTPRPIGEAPPLRALRGEVVTSQEEMLRTPATGELRYRQVSAAPVRDDSGNIIGSVSVVRDITAHMRAEEEREQLLKENLRQRVFLERLIETAPVGLAVVRGPDHRYEMVNPCYQAIPGVCDAPMVGRTIAQVFPDVVAQGALAMVERVYQTGQTVGAREYEASVGPEREQTYWDVDHVPLRGPDGTVDGVLILADQVTDQVLAHRKIHELAESLAQERDVLQTIMENTPAQLAYLDPELNFMRVNAAYAEGSGHAKEELIGHNHFDLFPDPENQAIFEGVRDVGQPVAYRARPFEYADQPERGVTYWDWTLVPVRDRDGQVQGLVFSLMDVTEQERARRELDQYADRLRILHGQEQRHAEELEVRVARRTAALQASQARLRTILDGAAMGIALADLEGRILESNPALQAMLGYSADELGGMLFTDLAHPEDIATDREQFQELIAGTRQEVRVDQRCIRKDGQIVWARLMISLVQSGPDPVYAIGLVEDITEQKQMQAALLKAEKLAIAGQLGASLAHEINNPLQSVIGCLGLADKNLAEGADVTRYLQVAREELRRAAGIVAQFRDLHRISEPEEKKATDLNALLEQVLLLCKKKCEECRIQVGWNAADDLPLIPLVSDRMRQVFLNLILNALDATPEGGRLEVTTARTSESAAAPDGVRISFADSGSGIAPDELPHLFEPFYSTKPQGLGLGLYITRSIVEAHGGHIDVSSHQGEGTTFSVWLPA